MCAAALLARDLLLQQHPAVVGSRGALEVVVEDETVVLPAVEPLDAVVEFGKEARGGLRELFRDLADEPAMGALPAHVDGLAFEGGVEEQP